MNRVHEHNLEDGSVEKRMNESNSITEKIARNGQFQLENQTDGIPTDVFRLFESKMITFN